VSSESKLASAFDAMADDYDRQFTLSTIGDLMRQAVWRKIRPALKPGFRFLELNCGTGEDALWLAQQGVQVLATDLSSKMLDVARGKINHAGLSHLVQLRQLGLLDLDEMSDADFDGVLSNFGGLNCVERPEMVAGELARRVRPGGSVFVCMMGPVCLWEWLWFVLHGEPRKAFRRMRRGCVEWRGMKIYYPAIGEVQRAFDPDFTLRRRSAIGALVPPPYVEAWGKRHPELLAFLNSWERRLEDCAPLPWIADHYLLEFVRR
jgi:ubiquinone/menaquinone biosynthesis C-methylase UbiE